MKRFANCIFVICHSKLTHIKTVICLLFKINPKGLSSKWTFHWTLCCCGCFHVSNVECVCDVCEMCERTGNAQIKINLSSLTHTHISGCQCRSYSFCFLYCIFLFRHLHRRPSVVQKQKIKLKIKTKSRFQRRESGNEFSSYILVIFFFPALSIHLFRYDTTTRNDAVVATHSTYKIYLDFIVKNKMK